MKRFLDKVKKTDDCWLWIAGSRGNGYGAFKLEGKVVDAHRVSWMLFKGKIPDNLLICHTCDNRRCVNPDHLFIGTYQDNAQDCISKGRFVINPGPKFRKGNTPPHASITQERADQLKILISERGQKPMKQLADEQQVSRYLLNDIRRGRAYGVVR